MEEPSNEIISWYKLMLHFITIEELVKRLEYKKLNSQYFFGTEKAISKLKRIWH